MSADPTFVSNRLAELPAILNGPEGQAWARGMGAVQDEQLLVAQVAAVSRLPALCPDDALDAVGGWFKLERFPGEPDGTAAPPTGYRGRLLKAFQTWLIAGSSGAIIQSLNQWGVPDVTITGDVHWLGSMYTRSRVTLGPDTGSYNWSVGNPPTDAQKAQIRAQILKWKWDRSYPVDVTFTNDIGVDPFVVGPILGVYDERYFILDEDRLGGYRTL